MLHNRLVDWPTLIDFVESLLRPPLSIWPCAKRLRSWFSVPRLSRLIGANRLRAGTETRKTARPIVELLEDRTVPSTFMVNELSDTHAVNLATGMDVINHVSLRSAIEAADHLGGDQTIQFDPGVFAARQTIILRLGLLDLNDAGGVITIQGPTAGVTINGNYRSEVFRVNAGTTADLTGLTIVGGKVTGWAADYGGGIYNNGTLTLTDAAVAENVALTPAPIELFGGYGGGIYNNASLTLVDSTVSGNISGSAGAGVDNSINGTLSLVNATVSGNRLVSDGYCVVGSGGGICNGGSASLTGSTILGNSAALGGGINNSGTLTITDSLISSNATVGSIYNQGGAWGAGGGIFNSGTATLGDSTLSGNIASGFGVNGVGGGIGSAYAGTTILNRCTLSNNSARSGAGIGCVAPYSYSCSDPVTLNDCTISGNRATSDGGGIYLAMSDDATLINSTISGNSGARGGGVYLNQAATLTCDNSTIAGNLAVAGGGVFVQESVNYVPALNLKNTIIAGNTSRALDGDVVGAVSPSSVNNLIGDGTGIIAGIRNNSNGNQVGSAAAPINPLMAPLANYGGPAETMALLPGSPAIDAGSNAAIPAGVTTDQRGLPRIVNGTVDIGAYEFDPDQAPDITSASLATFVVGKASRFTVCTVVPFATLGETGPLPAGLSFTDNGNGTATIQGTPTAGAACLTPYCLTIQACNGAGATVTQTLDLTVNQAPAITSVGRATLVVGQAGSFTVSTTGFPAAVIHETGALPAGLTWTDNGNGTATLSGTPLAGSARASPYLITIQASNGVGASAMQNFKLTIEQVPVITSAASATFTVGKASGFLVKVAPGVPAATTFTETGQLPKGVTLNRNGVLTGTPVAGTVGTYHFTISASNGLLATQSFTLTVNQPPAITSAASATFLVGQANTFTVTTTGFPVAALSETGVLPPSVTLTDNGDGTATLAGIPLANAGSQTLYRFTIHASNGVVTTATQTFVILLKPAPVGVSAAAAK